MSEQTQQPAVLQAREVQKLAMETAAKGAERAAANASLTGPQRAVAEVAAQNLGANRAREAALTVTTGLKHTADAAALEDRAFLSNVDKDGKRVAGDPSETARQTQVRGLREAYTKLLLEPATLTTADINILKPQVEAMIKANAAQFPHLLEAYQNAAGNIDAALIKDLIKNPVVANALATEMNRIYDGAAANLPKVAQIEERTLQAQQSLARATTEKGRLEAQKKGLVGAAKRENDFLTKKDYEVTLHDGTKKPGISRSEGMGEIAKDLATSGTAEVTSYVADLANLRALEAQLKVETVAANKKTLEGQITAAKQKMAKAETDPAYGRLCKDYKMLTEEEQAIQDQVRLSKDPAAVAALEDQIIEKTNEMVRQQKAIEDLQLEKNTMVGEMESAMKNALAEACAQYITQEKNAVFENYPAFERQARSQIEENARRRLHEALKDRYFCMQAVPASLWERVRGGAGRQVFRPVYDSATATKDIIAFTDKSFKPEDWLLQRMTAAGIKSGEAKMLLQDPEFVKDQMAVATQRALRAHEWKNGMGPETINGLVDTEWGAAALDYVIKQNEAARDLTQEYAAQGGHISRNLRNAIGPGYLVGLIGGGALMLGSLFIRRRETH